MGRDRGLCGGDGWRREGEIGKSLGLKGEREGEGGGGGGDASGHDISQRGSWQSLKRQEPH